MTRCVTLAAVALLLPAFAEAQCLSTQPGPINGQPWVCVGGGWLPPGSAPAPAPPAPPTVTPPPSPIPPPPAVPFRTGRTYQRGDTLLYIMTLTQTAEGWPVFMAQCLQVGDGCFTAGYFRAIGTNVSAADWIEVTR